MAINIDFSSAGVNGLLNNKSMSMKLKYVAFEDIVRNDNNNYAINDIDRLAESIRAVGLREPIEVCALADGKYKIIGGERRYTAIKQLRAEGDDRYDEVPCIVADPATIDLPLSPELKELYAITTTNAEQRDKTDADILAQVSNLKKIYAALKDAGYRLGAKQRDLLSKDLNISKTQAQRYSLIDNNLMPELKNELANNNLPFTVAVEAAKMTTEEQKELLDSVKTDAAITQKDIESYKATRKASTTTEPELAHHHLDVDTLQNEYTRMLAILTRINDDDDYSAAAYNTYTAAVKRISAALDSLDKIIHAYRE